MIVLLVNIKYKLFVWENVIFIKEYKLFIVKFEEDIFD